MKNKNYIISIIAVLSILFLIAIAPMVFAETTTHSSYLDMMAGNTTLKGGTIYYPHKYHRIILHVKKNGRKY